MIELLATIDLGVSYDAEVVSATSSIPKYDFSANLIEDYNVLPLPFRSFKMLMLEKETVTETVEMPRRTFIPLGVREYNGEYCYAFSLAHQLDLWPNKVYQTYMVNDTYADLTPRTVVNESGETVLETKKEGAYYEYFYNENKFKFSNLALIGSIGLECRVYIPFSILSENDQPEYFFPIIYSTITFSRDEIKTYQEISVETDKPANNLLITFDAETNSHPKRISVDGKGFSVKSSSIECANLSYSKNHKIVIYDWVGVSPNVYISAISPKFDGVMEIGKSKMLSCGSSIIDRGDTSLPSFGIVSNGGNLSFSDYDDSILQMAQLGFLGEGANAKIFLADKLNGIKKVVGDFYTDTWSYDNNAKSVSVSLKDDLEELQDIVFEGLEYNFETREAKSAKQLYEFLYGKTPEKFGFVPFDSLSASTKSVLEKTIVKFPYLEKGNLWSAWVKLCELCQLYIFKEYGKTKCEYRGGS